MKGDRHSTRSATPAIGQTAIVALTLLISVSLPAPVWAAGGPQESIRELVAAVSTILQDPAMQGPARQAERRDRIGVILREAFDFENMARESLGVPWTRLTPAQRAEFTRLFSDRFTRSYSLLVLRFLGERRTTYAGESIQGEGAVVRTALVSAKDGTLPVEYRLTSAGERWTVADVVVDGVSLTGNYRAQFSKIIRTASYETLLGRMRKPVE